MKYQHLKDCSSWNCCDNKLKACIERSDYVSHIRTLLKERKRINKIKASTHLICPESSSRDYVLANDDVNFWIDDNDVWCVDCHVCGGEHCLGDMYLENLDD